jgi:hypothetical protein
MHNKAVIATHLEFWKKKGDTDRRADPLSGTSIDDGDSNSD